MKRKKNPPKRTYDEVMEDLMKELEKPHTEKEYEAIQRRIRNLSIKSFIKGISFPLISFIISITVLIVQLLLLL